ncbi:MAG: hypothetical protein P4M11_09735 [Candidatus Pacebacteria bacterium]|nr:hypothetical protein [Candidatus Paceibacterota bacterium]
MSSSSFVFYLEDGTRVPAHRRKNPDGTVGGWVADTAIVDAMAIVEVDAIVRPGAIVGIGAVIRNGEVAM